MTDPRTDPRAELVLLHDGLWQILMRGAQDRTAPGRHVTLATTGPDGAPQLRMVVLRAADRAGGVIDIHTDIRSAKVAALGADPRAEVLAWDPEARLQIRAAGTACVITGAGAAALWARVPAASRATYGAEPPPGAPIPGPLAYEPGGGSGAFGVIRLTIGRIEALHLGERHRRASFDRQDGWRGQWLSP